MRVAQEMDITQTSPDYIHVPHDVPEDTARAHLVWCVVIKYGVPTDIAVKIHEQCAQANVSVEGARIDHVRIKRLNDRLKQRKH